MESQLLNTPVDPTLIWISSIGFLQQNGLAIAYQDSRIDLSDCSLFRQPTFSRGRTSPHFFIIPIFFVPHFDWGTPASFTTQCLSFLRPFLFQHPAFPNFQYHPHLHSSQNITKSLLLSKPKSPCPTLPASICWSREIPILYMIIKKMYEPKRESRYLLQGSEEQFSYSSPAAPKSIKNPHQHFQSLFVARQRFCEFVNTLGELKHSEIRDDILVHCQQNSRKERIYQSFMSDETILKIINLRIDKMIKNKRIKKNWSQEDVQILIWVISKYADKHHFVDIEKELDEQDWEAVASLIPGVTAESCMFKWLSLKKINLATNNWSEEESNLLAQLVNEKGFEGKSKDTKDWKLISQRLYFLNARDDKIFRNAKQCREHWNCYLNPNLKKGPWKPQEDIQLLKCIKQNKGSKKWSQIVKYFDGRTQNALKNRYTLIIEKQKKHNKHKNELQIIEEYLVRCYVDQFTTEIRQYSSQEINRQSSEESFQGIKEQNSIEQRMEKPIVKIQDDFNVGVVTQAPITPVKVEKFKGFLMAKEKFDFNSILLGTLSNGVFEKTAVETDLSSSSTPSKLKLKKYHSSLL